MQQRDTSWWVRLLVLFYAAALTFLVSGCLGASSPPASVTITGSWNIFHTPTGSTQLGPDIFTFTQTGNSISGTTSQGQTVTGTLTGSNITFSWTASNVTNTYSGTVSADGTTMSGTYTTSASETGSWSATKGTSSTVSITGTWNMFITPSNTNAEQTLGLFTFTQTGNTISGTTAQGQQLAGTLSGQNVSFSWVDSGGNTNTFTGSVGTTAMTGTYTVNAVASGSWRAAKQ